MSIKRSYAPTVILLFLTLISGYLLSSHSVSADDMVVDNINIVVPVSCTLTGVGMDTHNATINNGTYQSDIGTTTIKAFCNDSEGFSIYAIGYTNDTDGNNVLASSNLSSTYDIITGTSTTGNSQWAMKLATQTTPEPTYPISIQNGYNNYHTVPDDYALVAKRTASTDTGSEAIGSTLTTTYQIFISTTQPSDTYTGKVKYVMVHPNYVDSEALKDAVTVIFDGNGLTFPNGQTTNTVKYASVCKPGESVYVGSNYQEAMSSNITSGGQQNGAYTDHESVLRPITLPNADGVKVVVEYGLTADTMGLTIVGGDWDGDWDNLDPDWAQYEIYDNYDNISDTETFFIVGDTVTIYAESYGTPETGYDKGFYARVYPIYLTEQPGTTEEELPSNDCSIVPISGNYMETTEWHGRWTAEIAYEYESCDWDDELQEDVCEMVTETDTEEFKDKEAGCYEWGGCWDAQSAETFLLSFLDAHDSLKGKTLTLYSRNPVTFDYVYATANKTKLSNYYKIQDLNASMCSEVTTDEITTVIDARDNNTYSIGKLADGNCWLRDNLRLDPTNSTTANNMSASNTNATNDAIYNYLHGGNPNNNTGWTSTAVSSPSDWPNNTRTIPYINVSDNESYGIYYNYCAATVGTYCYSANSGDGNVYYDICPAGWKLPSETEVNSLNNSTSNIVSSLNLVKAGKYNSGGTLSEPDSISDAGSRGVYWTSNGYYINRNYARVFLIENNRFSWDNQGSYSFRANGHSVRCILDSSN